MNAPPPATAEAAESLDLKEILSGRESVASSDRAVPVAGRLSRTAAFYLQASITVAFLAGSSAPTPLYPLYQAQWGFSPWP